MHVPGEEYVVGKQEDQVMCIRRQEKANDVLYIFGIETAMPLAKDDDSAEVVQGGSQLLEPNQSASPAPRLGFRVVLGRCAP